MIGTAGERRGWLDSRYPSWKPMMIWERFRESAFRYADRVYITDDEGDHTYREILGKAQEVLPELRRAGALPGTFIGLQLFNSADFLVYVLAINRLGAAAVLLNPNLTPEMRRPFLEQTDARILIAEQEDGIPQITVEKEEPFPGGKSEAKNSSFGAEDPACIIFTSGSTSRPKSVLVSNDTILRTTFGTCRTRCMEEGRRIFLPIPLFHAMAFLEGLLAVQWVGGSVVITKQKFNADDALDTLLRERCNDFVCVSLLAMRMLERQKVRKLTFPCLHAAYWASSCPATVWEEAAEAFRLADITTAYGMTECGSTSVMMSPEDPVEKLKECHGRIKKAGAAGMPEADGALLRMEIRDQETGAVLPAGEAGVVWCKGLTVTHGYYRNEEATKKAFDPDGWFFTGDVGRFDEDGYFQFLGRTDDMYKINGENVSPAQVDAQAVCFSGIRQTAAVGIDQERYGQVGVLFTDMEADPRDKDEAFRAYLREHLLSYQFPKYIIYLSREKWPKTASGKISRKELKKMAGRILEENPGVCSIYLS